MKKTYSNPTMTIVKTHRVKLLNASATTQGLEGFGGYGGNSGGGKSADARGFDFFDDEE